LVCQIIIYTTQNYIKILITNTLYFITINTHLTMKQQFFSKQFCFALLIFMGLFCSCSYKTVESQDQACFSYELLSCEGNGLKFRLKADCSIDAPNEFEWNIQGNSEKRTGQVIEYTFSEQKDYTVTLVVKGSDFTDEITQTINANRSTISAFAKSNAQPGKQEAQSMATMPDGSGYVVCGFGENAGITKCFLTKFDTKGASLWHETYKYQQSTETRGYGVVVEGDGTILVAGSAVVNGKKQVYLLKVSAADGAIVADGEKIISNVNNQEAFYLSKTPSGNYYYCGQDYNHNTYGSGLIQKLDGNLNTLGFPDFTNGAVTHQIKAMESNGFVVAGGVFLPTDNTYSKFKPLPYVGRWKDNSLSWEFRPAADAFNPDKIIEIFAVTPLADGTFAICGNIEREGQYGQVYIAHLSNGGQLLNEWELPQGKIANDVIEAADGNNCIVVAGVTSEGVYTDDKDDNSFIFKFSLNTGSIVWRNDQTLGGTRDDCYSIIPTLDCGYMAAGRANATGNLDVNLVKINLDGQ
jgi:PKD repeat protein